MAGPEGPARRAGLARLAAPVRPAGPGVRPAPALGTEIVHRAMPGDDVALAADDRRARLERADLADGRGN